MIGGFKKFSDLESYFASDKNARIGCLVDTSILFSASETLDPFNEDAEKIFNLLAKNKVPVFSNVNVRTEFIEQHRRVAIPTALIDFLKDMGDALDSEVVQQLTSLRTRYRSKMEKDQLFKLSDDEIKKYRKLLSKFERNGKDGWEAFCAEYLSNRIQVIWDTTVDQLGLNFISLRAKERHPMIEKDVNWEDMVKLVERFGIGSMDAMILNMFQCSKLNLLITSDMDFVYCIERLKLTSKVVATPDSL